MTSIENINILDPALIENPYSFYRALVAKSPLYQVPGTEVYLVSSRDLIKNVLANHADYSANLTGILIRGTDGSPQLFDLRAFGGTVDAIANADEPSHSVHRRLVMPQLTARKIALMEPSVRRWARLRIETLVNRGSGDWVGQVAEPVPLLAMARLIGLPQQDLPRFLDWGFSGGEILAGTVSLEKLADLAVSTAAMSEYLSGCLARASALEPAAQADDIIGELVKGIRDGLITEPEAVSILIVLVGAAGESTASLIGSAVRLLAQDQALQQTLRASSDLLPGFIEEVVRLESPFRGHYRVVKQPTELAGRQLPKDARVLLMWAAANRDPAFIDDPDTLNLARHKPRTHLGFGKGMHFCVGARLARMETRVVLEELLRHCRHVAIEDNAPPAHYPSLFVRRLVSLPLRFS